MSRAILSRYPRNENKVINLRLVFQLKSQEKRYHIGGTIMSYFQWKDEYSVGIAKIDEQHKRLVDILNELFISMKSGQGSEKVGMILSKLIDYTQKHFSDEEALMGAEKYSGLAVHKNEHARLAAQVLDFQRQYQANNVGVSVKVSGFLKEWLIQHILKEDKQYAIYLATRRT